MRVHDQEVTFNVFKAMKFPTDEEECFRVDLVNKVLNDEVESLVDNEPLRSVMAGNSELEDEEFEELVHFLDTTPQFKKLKTLVEPLKKAGETSIKLKPSLETPSELELKPLPDHLRYAFLNKDSKLPVIISSALSSFQEEKLIRVLREFKSAIGWTIADIKGISPFFCMHKILLEDDSKPSVEHQRRLNPIMKEVVKKEVLK